MCTLAPLFRKEKVTFLWLSSLTLDFIKGLLFISEQININDDIILPLITKLTVHWGKNCSQIRYKKYWHHGQLDMSSSKY